MTSELEYNVEATAAEFERIQEEAKKILGDRTSEILAVSADHFEMLMDIVLTPRRKRQLDLRIGFNDNSFIAHAIGVYLDKPYSFTEKVFSNGEIGWRITFIDEDGDENHSSFPFENLDKEILKVLVRYKNMSEKSEQSSTDDEIDSDADLTAEKEE